jgi:VIT1/CCC1 family predicted Fe2+/Mn2+ transporter
MASTVRDLNEAQNAYDRRDSKESIMAHRKKYTSIGGMDGDAHSEDGHSDAGDYLKSFIFGGLDGTVTTFTLVCAAIGGSYPVATLMVLGVAKVLSDAISMGLGDALSEMAEGEFVRAEKAREKWEMQNYLEGELEEMVELYVKKGFKEQDAKKILKLMVDKNPAFFLDHMLVQELGLMPPDEDDSPIMKGLVMFCSFAFCGMCVLIPFVIAERSTLQKSSQRSLAYAVCVFITMCVLGGLGVVKAKVSKQNPVKSGFQYIAVGGLSASVAFGISAFVRAY